MKKFVTLSAIALAGATLGVGSTFGWWSDGSEDEPEKTKAKSADIAEKLDAVEKVEFVEKVDVAEKLEAGEKKDVEIIEEVVETKNGVDVTKVVRDGNLISIDVKATEPAAREPVKVLSRSVRVLNDGNRSEVEKLANLLEQEAKQMDEQGQKEAAAIQRKVAIRLRDALKAGAVHDHVVIHKQATPPVAKQPMSEAKNTTDRAKERIGQTRDILEQIEKEVSRTDDKERRQHLDKVAENLRVKLQQLTARAQVATAEAAVKEAQARIEAQQKAAEAQSLRILDYKLAFDQPTKPGHIDLVARHLREVAERLEKEGRKDESRAVRQHVEEMIEKLARSKAEDAERARNAEIKLDEQRKLAERRKEELAARLRERHTQLRSEEGDQREQPRERSEEAHRHTRITAAVAGEGALRELHQQLKELRHEIGELRDDVRNLRKELTAGRHEKEDGDDDDDEGDDDDKKRSAKSRNKEKPADKDDDEDDKPSAKGRNKEKPADKDDDDEEGDDDDDKPRAKKRVSGKPRPEKEYEAVYKAYIGAIASEGDKQKGILNYLYEVKGKADGTNTVEVQVERTDGKKLEVLAKPSADGKVEIEVQPEGEQQVEVKAPR